MIWISLKKLEAEIIAATLSDKTVVNYFIIETVVLLLTSSFVPKSGGYLPILTATISACINIAAVVQTFKLWEEKKTGDYFKNQLAIWFVCGFQAMLATILLGIILVAFALPNKGKIFLIEELKYLLYGALLIINIYFLYYLPIRTFKNILAEPTS